MAKARRKESVKLLGVVRRKRAALLVSTALQASVVLVLSIPGFSQPAAAQPAPNARPTGGTVIAGSASISRAPTQTTIDQSSNRAALSWRTYNVGSNQSVVYHQPSANSVTLNRVEDPNPSQIAGHIEANGKIVLMNQAGVTFYKGAQVNTNGLMVTAASMSDGAMKGFVNTGVMKFDRAPDPNARVENRGNITIKQAGLAALVAPSVANSGTIDARLGHVVLAGADHTTLDMYGDGLVSIDVSGEVKKVPVGPDGKPVTALVTNTGVIRADGGVVQLTARQADGVVTKLVDAGGSISANSVDGHTGVVALNGIGGDIVVQGQLSAAGQVAGSKGGDVKVNTTGNVSIASSARIDASGQAGGGTVALGTTLARAKGGPSITPTLTAANVHIAKGAVVRADATAKGDGGHVTVLSTHTTTMNGEISARGGPQGGDGGFVETSGDYLGMNSGSVDVGAPKGTVGSWLLDPTNLYIVSGSSGSADQDANFNSGSGTILAGGSNTTNNQLSAGALDNFSGSVTLQAANTLDVQSSFSIGSGGLTMQAGNFLQVGSGVAVSASGDILAQTTASGLGIDIVGLLTSTGGSVSLKTAAGSQIAIANQGTVSVPTAGKSVVLQTDTLFLTGGHISAPSGTVEIAPITAGTTISLGNTNSAGTLGLANNFSGINATVLRLGEAGGSTTASDIVLDANVNLGNVSTLDLHGTGSVFRSANSFALTAGTLTGNIGGDFNLASGYSTGNTIAAIGSFTVGAANQFQLVTNGGVTVAGPVDAGTFFYEADVSGSNPTIAITGSVGASGSMLLSSVSGTIGISGSLIAPQVTLGTAATLQATGSAVIGQAGGTLSISAGGGFSEANTGTIAASTLNEISAYGVGTVSLLGTANAITTVGSLSNSGDFALVSNSALTVTDTLASTGNIFLQTSNAGGITVAAAGSVLAGSGKLASLQTDALSNSGTITGGTIELAPYTPGTTTKLGSGYLSSLAGLGAGTVRIGAVTQPNGTLVTTTGSISITNPFGTNTTALDLRSTGSVTQHASGYLTASTLSAVVNNITLNSVSNQIGTLGDITATNNLLIASQSLVVAGTLQSGSVGTTPNVSNTTTIGLAANTGTIQLGVPAGQAAVLNGGTVMFVGSNGAVSEPNGTIIANDVAGQGSNTGGVTLAGTANIISAIGSFSITGGGLTVASTGSLSTFGGISAPNILLNAGTIGLGGSLNAGTVLALNASAGGVTETGNTIVAGTLTSGGGTIVGGMTLGGTANAIGTLGSVTVSGGDLSLVNTGSLSVGGPVGANNISLTSGTIGISGSLNAGTVLALGASSGGVSQATTSAINAPTLTSIGTIAGGMTLAGTANTIGTINALQAAGLFSVVNSQALTLNGLTSAGTVDITTSSGGVTQGSAGTLIAGTLTSTGSIAGNALFQGTANQIGTIGALHAGGTLQVVDGTTLTGAGTVAAPTISLSATGLTLNGALNAGTLLALGASATGVTEPGSAVISAPTLTSIGTITGGVTLAGTANAIGSFGNFDYAGTLALEDAGSLFSINGILSAGTGDALVLDAKSISIGSGGVVNVGTLQLTTSNGGVSESAAGTIITNALSIATTGSGDVALLSPNNQIAETTGIQVANGNLILVDDPTLTLTGTHSANNLFFQVTASGDTIAVGSTSTPAVLSSTLGSGGRISLIADHLTENASSTITAPSGTVELAPFTSATAISLAGASSSGLLLDSTLLGEISTSAGSLVVGRYTDVLNGSTIARTGGAILLDGAVNLTGGQAQTLLLDSNGTISEPTGTLAVNTLTGTAVSVGLTGVANTITNLASFGVTQNVTLDDNAALNVIGSVTAGTNIALAVLNGGSLAIGNSGTVGLLNAGSTVALSTTGSITEDPNNGTIIAATLTGPTSAASAAAGASLLGSGNTITTLGDFYTNNSTGSFQLLDQRALSVLGTVAAGGTLSLDVNGGGGIAIGNGSTAGLLDGGTTGTVALQSTGAITQDANNGTIVAQVLSGPTATASAANSVTLTNLANQVGTLGSFLTVNDFDFRDGIPLTLAGTVQPSTGSVFIQEAAGKGLTFNGGSVIVNGQTIGLIADSLTYTSGTIDAGLGAGGTVEIAPTTSGTAVGLGGGSGLALSTAALGAISGNELRIGAYHDRLNGGTQTITAGSIDIAGNASLASTAINRLRLDTTGAVTESAGTLSVGTLVGTASNGYTIAANASNAIGTLGATGASGTLTASNGNIRILDAGPLAVQNTVSAPSGNIFLKNAAGTTLSFLNGGSVVVSGGTIGLVSDLLSVASGASITAGTGTVEIAPTTAGRSVTLAGIGSGLSIDSTALGEIKASWLRIGGYRDQANSGANTVTAGSMDLAGTVSLGTAVVPALRLDSTGPITESAGPLSVGTLSVSTNGSVADVSLGNTLNVVPVLDNMTVGGNLTLADNAGTLTIPTNAVVYGNNVTINNTGSVLVLGDLGAAAGTLSLAAGGNMTVGGTGNDVTLIGATGAATLNATGAFDQLSGLINADGVSITAGTKLTQSAGAIINAGTSAGVAGLVINGGSQFVQSSAGTIASNNDGTISTGAAGSIAASGTILTAGSLALIANTFTQHAGTIAAGGNLAVEGSALGAPVGGNILQAGGTMDAGATLALIGNFTSSDASQTGGVLAGNTIEVTSATENTPFQSFAPAILTGVGANTTVACTCSGLITDYVNPSPAAPGSIPSLPTLSASGASRPHHLLLDVIDSTTPSAGIYTLNQSISADWVEIHTSGAFAEAAGRTITATLLSGTAGYAPTGTGPGATFTTPFSPNVVSSATITNANSIADLGPFLATGDFRLTDANSLTVVNTIVAGGTVGGQVLALTAPAISVDQSGSVTTPDGLSIAADGLLQAGATTSSGTVTPGQILLRTDALTLTPLTAGNTVVNAPDGLVAIAPLTSGTNIDLDTSGTSSAGTLVLTQAMLDTIKTLGGSAGTAGTQTLMLGSLDGATPAAGKIDVNAGIVLGGIARNLVLDSTGAVQENAGGSLSVVSLAGTVGTAATSAADGSISLTNGNTIAELGNVATRTVGGVTYVSTGTPGSGLLNLTAKGDVRISDSTGSLVAVGAVTANAGANFAAGTIALTAPTLEVISGATTLSTGTIASAGSLLATAGTIASGTLTPSKVLLATDDLHIVGPAGTPIVRAPSGEVAIAPMTSGNVIAIDSTASSSTGTLSLGTADLALIDTMSGPLSGATLGPVGTQTFALGSLDDGATTAAGGIDINTQVTLGGSNLTGNTLALYSTGDAVETPAGASPTGGVTVNTLIGTVTTGNIYLNGTNDIANLGNLGTLGGVTTPSPVNAGLTASGNVLVRNDASLDVVTTVQAGSASPNYVELDVLHSGADLTVLNGGTVTAGDVYLRAGDSATSGNVTVAAGGSVFANGNADLAAGVQYTAATPGAAPSHAYTQSTNGGVTGNVAIEGLVHAGGTGTIGLYAHNDIDEPLTATDAASIQGGVLTGFAGGHAYLLGYGSPTDNLIADLAGFTTDSGFILRDGTSLAVIGSGVTDASTGITIAVAASGTVAGLFGTADLALAAPVVASSGTVKLEATGNVYETNGVGAPGSIVNSAGTFAVTGGVVNAATLVSQSGAIPDTETSGNAPGTIPTTANTFGRAIDWFGNTNSVATLGNVTATGNFLLNNGQDLSVAGTVMAGTLPLTDGTVAATYPVVSGPFGTSPTSTPAPFAEIDVVRSGAASSGNLGIANSGIVHAGVDGAVTGSVTLRAGDASTAGSVTIGTTSAAGGAVFAANGGTVAISAGYDPTQPAGSQYFAACGSVACGIEIDGTVWGNSTLGTADLAGLVQLNAASSIDEKAGTSRIGATLLSGEALRHAELNQTNSYGTFTAGNLIANLGSFTTNAGGFDDFAGFQLWDRRSLTVTGAVTDQGPSTSNGIRIVVAPGSGSTYSAGDLTLRNTLSAATTVMLQTTGAITEGSGGVIDAKTLSVQAGLIPYPESFNSNFPGETPLNASATIEVAAVTLNNANHIANLGTPTLGVTTTGDFSLTNVGDLHVGGGLLSTTGNITISDSGTVTSGTLISAPMQNISISAGSIINDAQIEAGNDVALSGTTGIFNNGLVSAGHNASLTAAAGVIDNGSLMTPDAMIEAVNLATLAAQSTLTNRGTVSVSGTDGAVAMTSNGADIETSGTIQAAGTSGSVNLTAQGSINQTAGNIMAQGQSSTVTLTAGTSIVQTGGTILSGGTGTILPSGAATPNLSLIAQTGSIEQDSGAQISAPGYSGVVGLNAKGSINLGGTIQAADPAFGSVGSPGLSLVSTNGAIIETTTGNLSAPLLVGSAANGGTLSATAGNGNLVANLGPFTVQSGDFALTDERSLAVTGPVVAYAGSVTIVDTHLSGAPSSLTNNSTIQGQTGVTLVADDNIVNSAGAVIAVNGTSGTVNLIATGGSISSTGVVQAPNLTGFAAASATLNNTSASGNQIANLGSFTVDAADGWLMLNDGRALQVSGPLQAQTIDIDVGANALTFAPGAIIRTGGEIRPTGSLSAGQLPRSPFRGGEGIPLPGAYFFAGSVQQNGGLTVIGTTDVAPSILRIDVTTGPITFSSQGLNAPGTWLILNGADGFISGAINVKALDVTYSGGSGGAGLIGKVGGLSGRPAAGRGNIGPTRNARYHVNSCPIASVNCVLLPTMGVPAGNPLNEIFIGSFFNPQDEGDLLLPIVSDQDY